MRVQGEAVGRVRYQLLEKMLQPVASKAANWYNDDKNFGAAIREVEEAKRLVIEWPTGLTKLLDAQG